MLIKSFYTIIDSVTSEEKIEVRIQLNPDNMIYEGHFPGQPVVPGVMQLQIVKEVIERSINRKLLMSNLVQVKYLIPIVPDKNMVIDIVSSLLSSDENKYRYNISISSDDSVFTKAKIEFSL